MPHIMSNYNEYQFPIHGLDTYFNPSHELLSALKEVNVEKDIECINNLLENSNLTYLIKNTNRALDTAEIDSCLFHRIQYLFRSVISNGTDSLRPEDIAGEDVKLLRWLLRSYGIAAAWNGLAETILRDVESTVHFYKNREVESGCPVTLENLEKKLKYYAAMLREDSYFDAWGGPLLMHEVNSNRRDIVPSRASIFMVFTREREDLVRTPAELQTEVGVSLNQLRDAMRYAWMFPENLRRKHGCNCQWNSEEYRQFMSLAIYHPHPPMPFPKREIAEFPEQQPNLTNPLPFGRQDLEVLPQKSYSDIARAGIETKAQILDQPDVNENTRSLTDKIYARIQGQDERRDTYDWFWVQRTTEKASHLLGYPTPGQITSMSQIYSDEGGLASAHNDKGVADEFQAQLSSISPAVKLEQRPRIEVNSSYPDTGVSQAQNIEMTKFLGGLQQISDALSEAISVASRELRGLSSASAAADKVLKEINKLKLKEDCSGDGPTVMERDSSINSFPGDTGLGHSERDADANFSHSAT